MIKPINIIPDLEVGEIYVVGGKPVVVKLADESGCRRCALTDECARFDKVSKMKDYHILCAAAYRDDKQSIVFASK